MGRRYRDDDYEHDRDRDRDSSKVTRSKSVTITKSSSGQGDGMSQAGGETVKNLLNILLIVVLTIMTLAFAYFFAKNPVLVITLSCVFIMMYSIMILYMINKVSSEDGFADNTITRVLRWSTMTVLIMAIMIAIATLLGAKAKDIMGNNAPKGGQAQPQPKMQQPMQQPQQQQPKPPQQQRQQPGPQNRQPFQPQPQPFQPQPQPQPFQ